jgi:hypothetical protein
MAFEEFLVLPDARLKALEIGAAVIRKGDRGEHDLARANLGQIDHGAVAGDETGCFQALDPCEARAGGQADLVRQLGVGDPPATLQFRKDVDVDAVEFGGVDHGGDLIEAEIRPTYEPFQSSRNSS